MIIAKEFFSAWLAVVNETVRKSILEKKWKNATAYTNEIINNDNSVIEEIAKRLGLLSYTTNYYSIDTILYSKEDLVPKINENTFWFKEIKVAFEHENKYNKDLYQEVSHLLITRCDLRVLVSYPPYDKEPISDYLHEIIKGTSFEKEISDNESFLLILGYEKEYQWEAFVYKSKKWTEIN